MPISVTILNAACVGIKESVYTVTSATLHGEIGGNQLNSPARNEKHCSLVIVSGFPGLKDVCSRYSVLGSVLTKGMLCTLVHTTELRVGNMLSAHLEE
ncbi:hypothetical protein PHLCEN_2v9971 [Hermanssonia centrifuga]|uniref:Uncharacterized protein n=1 Tax=Hermanssonia centrifuga TaxID=98765 RepID=A0A2R6NPC6_9APHY|nr:hypothetical protein PHLCEN_2v9971 [Hermanssonia centrifuga]